MKNKIAKISTAFLLLFALCRCAQWTDIEPKGYNMLQQVSDIDMLFNSTYIVYADIASKPSVFTNNFYALDLTSMTSMYNLITQPLDKPLLTACVGWDETIDRARETETDDLYTTYYGFIGRICNPTILMADAAEGDREVANRLKAEAYVLRAWFHYNLVNYFAKAYNPATAKEDGGIPYSFETDMLSVPNPKYSVQEVYDFILADLDAAFALNSLAAPTNNRMRVNSAFAYAVKAKALMSMRDYDGAYQAATASLAIENTIDDYNLTLTFNGTNRFILSRTILSTNEDLFYIEAGWFRYNGITPELAATVEPGNIFFRHLAKTGAYVLYFGIDGDTFQEANMYLNPCGLSTIDMYLTQAECLIRKGDPTSIQSGVDVLNYIRRHRVAVKEIYEPKLEGYEELNPLYIVDPADYYTSWVTTDINQGIAWLKQMERTENCQGPKYFTSLKRWNTEEAWKETLTKHLDCVTGSVGNTTPIGSFDLTLRPDSPLWIYPFPSRAIRFNPNLTQNY